MSRVVEAEAWEGWRPLVQLEQELPLHNRVPRERLRHECDAQPGDGSFDHQARMIEAQRARHVDRDLSTGSAEFPAIGFAAGTPLTDTLMPLEMLRDDGHPRLFI